MRALLMLCVLSLAACGADGDPEPVEGGISISGDARIGVVGRL